MSVHARALLAVEAAVVRLPLWQRIALALLALASLNFLGAFVTLLVDQPETVWLVAGCSALALLGVWIWHPWATRGVGIASAAGESAVLGIYLLSGPTNGFDLSVMYPVLIVRSYQDQSAHGGAARAPLYAVAFVTANVLLGRTGTREVMFLAIHVVGLLIIAAIFRRVSLWVQAEERTALLQAESIRALEESAEQKDAFLTAVSHELRTPLTMVKGGSVLLRQRDTELSDDQRQLLLDRVAVNADRLEHLLVDLLDIDRLTRGVIQPERRQVDLSSVVMAAIEGAELGARVTFGSPTEVAVSIDVGMTERIIENLVANARKYSPPDAPIHVTVTETEADALLVVEDRGPGVPDADKGSIFEPFHRLDHADPRPGVGLGLALVRRFARLQGGDVWVRDRDGGGTVFTVRLPKERSPDDPTDGGSPLEVTGELTELGARSGSASYGQDRADPPRP